MARSRAFRDTLSQTVDVSTLTDWLDVNAEYDTALRRRMPGADRPQRPRQRRSPGRLRRRGRCRLAAPTSSRALVVILSEIGRGGLNQAVITIEQARGELDSAISLIGATADASEPPLDDEPVAPPSP